MKRNAVILIVIVVLVIIAVSSQLILGKGEKQKSIEDIQKAQGVPVDVKTIAPALFQRWRTFSGEIEGKAQAVLYSNIPARVKKVHREQGDKVTRGRLIISLDPLSAAQTYSAQKSAKIKYAAAKRTYNRMLPLFEAGAISKEDFDKVKLVLEIHKAGLTDASYMTSLKSPIRGILTDLRVSPGDKVEPGQILAVVADISGAKVIMKVSQSDVEELQTGQLVVIGKDKNARVNISKESAISKISYSADMESRLFRVEVKLGKDKKIRPGTLESVQVLTYEAPNTLSVPVDSIIKKDNDIFVFVARDDEKSEKRLIKTGKRNDDRIEVLSGLLTGDKIVVWGQNRLVGGEKIKIIKEENKNNNPDA